MKKIEASKQANIFQKNSFFKTLFFKFNTISYREK